MAELWLGDIARATRVRCTDGELLFVESVCVNFLQYGTTYCYIRPELPFIMALPVFMCAHAYGLPADIKSRWWPYDLDPETRFTVALTRPGQILCRCFVDYVHSPESCGTVVNVVGVADWLQRHLWCVEEPDIYMGSRVVSNTALWQIALCLSSPLSGWYRQLTPARWELLRTHGAAARLSQLEQPSRRLQRRRLS